MPEAASPHSVDGSEDTIVAIATPAGRGALAVVRLSGPKAFAIARQHSEPWPPIPRQAHLSRVHESGNVLDQALVMFFPAPNSFTGEDTVEFSTHGGVTVPSSIVAALITSGARQAQPGEFTRRAVLNGKLDILQAEAISDLIDARSHAMQRTAIRQLDGGLSRRLADLRKDLITLEALIAYDVDFPDEDDGPVPRSRVERATTEIISSLKALLATSPLGELVREGALVVIAGPPNAGKSSLFNALIGSARAIVTEIPGTTRDALEAVVDGGRWPLRLVDTAGLRPSVDKIELLGIEVSERYLADADVVLACAESLESLQETARAIRVKSIAPLVQIRTKIDLVTDREQYQDHDGQPVAVSSETGEGLQRLLRIIETVLTDRHGEISRDDPILTRARHRFALSSACSEIEQFDQAWRTDRLPATVAAVHLRTAVFLLEELIGAVDVEDVFDSLFSSFCVGK